MIDINKNAMLNILLKRHPITDISTEDVMNDKESAIRSYRNNPTLQTCAQIVYDEYKIGNLNYLDVISVTRIVLIMIDNDFNKEQERGEIIEL